MRNKVIYILILLGLIMALKWLDVARDDHEFLEEFINSYYFDYEANPDNYVKTKAEIIEEADDSRYGFVISFFGSREWIVQFKLPDGTVVESEVARSENEKVGDIIEVAYEDYVGAVRNPHVTKLEYVESYTVLKTNDILECIVKIALVGMIGFGVVVLIKKYREQ